MVWKIKPARANRFVKGWGNNFHLKSDTTSKIKKLTKTKLDICTNLFSGALIAETPKNKPVTNSIKGYCQEITSLQKRQQPFKNKKLKIGILSNQRISFLHLGQKEGGVKTWPPFFQRKRHTFKKLPIHRPQKIEKKGVVRYWISVPRQFELIKQWAAKAAHCLNQIQQRFRSLKSVKRISHSL